MASPVQGPMFRSIWRTFKPETHDQVTKEAEIEKMVADVKTEFGSLAHRFACLTIPGIRSKCKKQSPAKEAGNELLTEVALIVCSTMLATRACFSPA